jgi:hypothetical protein
LFEQLDYSPPEPFSNQLGPKQFHVSPDPVGSETNLDLELIDKADPLGSEADSEELNDDSDPFGSQAPSEQFNDSQDPFNSQARSQIGYSPPSQKTPRKVATMSFLSLSRSKDFLDNTVMDYRVAGCRAIVFSFAIK